MNWVRNSRATGGGFVLLGLAMLAMALPMEGPRHMAYGPGVFPSAIGVLMVLGGLVVAFRREPGDRGPGAPASRRRITAFVLFAVAPLVFALILPVLGFLIAALPLIALLVVISGGRWPAAVATALASTLLLQVIFQQVMRVPLPWGLLEPYAGVLTWL